MVETSREATGFPRLPPLIQLNPQAANNLRQVSTKKAKVFFQGKAHVSPGKNNSGLNICTFGGFGSLLGGAESREMEQGTPSEDEAGQ